MADESKTLTTDEAEDELDEEISSSATDKEVIETEDEETKIPVSYETAEEALLSMFIQDDDIATLIAQSGLKDSHFLKKKNRLLYPILMDIRLSKGTCFDRSAKVQTNKGRKNISDVVVGDKVLTTGGVFSEVTHTFVSKYKGDIVALDLRGSDSLLVTPNHVFYVVKPKRLWGGYVDWNNLGDVLEVKAGELDTSYLLVTPIWSCSEDIKYVCVPRYNRCNHIPETLPLTDDLLKVIGLYVAEGCSDTNRLTFTFNIKEDNLSAIVVKYFSSLDIHCSEKENRQHNTRKVNVYSKQLTSWFSSWIGVGSHNKHIPWDLQCLKTDRMQLLFNYILYGDMSIARRGENSKRNKGVTIGQTSEQLSYQLFNIGSQIGYNSSWHKIKPRLHRKQVYRNYFVMSNNNSIYKNSNNIQFTKIDSVGRRYFDGDVFNMDVDVTHRYTVNGVLVHNCNYDLVADACEKEILSDGQNLLEYIGGMQELTNVIQSAPVEMDMKVAQAYINIVFEQYRLSKAKDAARWIVNQKKFDENKIVEKLSTLQQILTENITKCGLVGMDELVADAYARFTDRKANPEKYEGMKTGFYWLDKYRAIGRKRTCVIGARTGIGKSVFASNIITEMVLNELKVLLFTPELDKETYIDRLICARAKVDMEKWTDAVNITNDETTLIGKAQKELLEKASRNLFIEDRGSQTCNFILSSIKRHMLNHHVDVVVIDYLQKLHYYGDSTKKAITEIMEKFCAFGKDNNIAFIIISQLRRPQAVRGSEDKDNEPKKEDLKESGDIENFADSVILLHRNSITRIADRDKGWYKIDKNRTGPTTDNVELHFNEHYLIFNEVDLPEEGVKAYDSWLPDEERNKVSNEQEVAKLAEKLNK